MTCHPFTLLSTFTSIFTLIWDTRRLHHTVFSCLEKCELRIYLYSFQLLSKVDLRNANHDIQCCICTKITVEDSVLYTAHFSSTKWHTLYLSFRLQYWLKLCFQHFGTLPPAWKWESISPVNLNTQSQIWISITVFMLIIRMIFMHFCFPWSWFPNFAYMLFHYTIVGSLLFL